MTKGKPKKRTPRPKKGPIDTRFQTAGVSPGVRSNRKQAKGKPPEELEGIWAPELTKSWNKLNEKQQLFLIEWYTNGFHGTKAYQSAYRVNNEDTARTNASQLLAHPNIYEIRQAIQKSLKPPLERIQQVYIDAMSAETPIFAGEHHIMDAPDHKNRMAGADRLIKMHDLEKPTEVNVNHKGKVEFTVDTAGLKDILNGSSPD